MCMCFVRQCQSDATSTHITDVQQLDIPLHVYNQQYTSSRLEIAWQKGKRFRLQCDPRPSRRRC